MSALNSPTGMNLATALMVMAHTAPIEPVHITQAKAELSLLLRYCDEGIPVCKHNIERVLDALSKAG